MKFSPLLLGLLLAGCASYDPLMQGDHPLPQYQGDLSRCRQQAHIVAERIAGATPATEIKSLFTSSEPEHKDVRTCLQAKGYSL